jgi:hypothetical protein
VAEAVSTNDVFPLTILVKLARTGICCTAARIAKMQVASDE